MVGGLAFSQLVTLYITPVVYTYLDRLQHQGARWFRGHTVQATEDAKLGYVEGD